MGYRLSDVEDEKGHRKRADDLVRGRGRSRVRARVRSPQSRRLERAWRSLGDHWEITGRSLGDHWEITSTFASRSAPWFNSSHWTEITPRSTPMMGPITDMRTVTQMMCVQSLPSSSSQACRVGLGIGVGVGVRARVRDRGGSRG